MNWKMMGTAMLCAGVFACGGATDESGTASPAGIPGNAAAAPAATAVSDAAFRVVLEGAVDRVVEGTNPVSGARHGRYHIHMALPEREQGQPAMAIDFGRRDPATPTPGTYALGIDNGFRGSLEVYGDPQRDFSVSSGELVITGAEGDVLTGRFSFSARELTEEYSSQPEEIRGEGTFRTRPVK